MTKKRSPSPMTAKLSGEEKKARRESNMERMLGKVRPTVAAYAAESVPSSRQGLYLRAMSGEASPREAIKAMCQHCFGYQDLSKAIPECSSLTCPLWQYREGNK